MKKQKEQAYDLITKKLKNQTYLTYKDIANITGYNIKYISKLKKQIEKGNFHIIHGNSLHKSKRGVSKEEEKKIVELYKRTNVSVRKFTKFYNKRSYSCIYNILDKNNLIKKEK